MPSCGGIALGLLVHTVTLHVTLCVGLHTTPTCTTRNKVHERLHVTHLTIGEASLSSDAYLAGRPFDILVCNPPYIPSHAIRGLDPEVLWYSPPHTYTHINACVHTHTHTHTPWCTFTGLKTTLHWTEVTTGSELQHKSWKPLGLLSRKEGEGGDVVTCYDKVVMVMRW